jgi:hypothetical protein
VFRWRDGAEVCGERAYLLEPFYEKVKAFDPRDRDQRLGDPTTWKETGNPALIMAQVSGGEAMNWDAVSQLANMCEQKI